MKESGRAVKMPNLLGLPGEQGILNSCNRNPIYWIPIMSATNHALEERITALEHEMQKIKTKLKMSDQASSQPWWEKQAGIFKDDPLFDEIIGAGKTYRQSLAPDEH